MNEAWHVNIDGDMGLQSVAYASCPDCGALVQIINDRIPEHYGR